MSIYITTKWEVIIAGGGPAGFFAAIRCAELNPQLRVLILEKSSQTLGKVLISGGGRCNVTHACFDPAQLVGFYPRGGMELRGAFTRFQPADTIKWFEARGVKLKIESDGRMFPVTDESATIANCLREAAKNAGVKVHVGASLLKVEKNPRGGFRLEVRKAGALTEGRDRNARVEPGRNACVEPSRNNAEVLPLQTKKLLIATGSDSKTREVVKALGHSIEEPVPSLFTFNVKDKRIDGLAGNALSSS